jgi:hypothetical protein
LGKSKIPPEFAYAAFEFVGIDGLEIERHGMK